LSSFHRLDRLVSFTSQVANGKAQNAASVHREISALLDPKRVDSRGAHQKRCGASESKIKQDVFEGRFGKRDTGTMQLSSFIDEIYVPWAKSNKTSWQNDRYNAVTLKNYFGEKKLKEIQPLDVERFKTKRLATETKHDTQRAPASVNREFEIVIASYNLAIEVGLIRILVSG
jgi:hypothetical protein